MGAKFSFYISNHQISNLETLLYSVCVSSQYFFWKSIVSFNYLHFCICNKSSLLCSKNVLTTKIIQIDWPVTILSQLCQ